MEFPTDAIHSPTAAAAAAAASLTPNRDGRDDTDQFDREMQHNDNGDANVVASGYELSMKKEKKNTKEASGRARVSIMLKSRNSDDEPVSPHIPVGNADPKQYSLEMNNQGRHKKQQQQHHGLVVVTSNHVQTPTTPTSLNFANNIHTTNSLLLNISDLEHSLNDETSTLKNIMVKMKSERDQLRQTKTALAKQLAHQQMLIEAEKKRYDSETSRLEAELSMIKSEFESEVQSMQKNLEEVQLHHKHEYDRMVEQNKATLDSLLLNTSAERENIMGKLQEAQNQVQNLQNEVHEAQAILTRLTEEVANNQITIESLLAEKRCFQLHEEESKKEIKRLQKILEEKTGDILQCFESNDENSQASSDGDDATASSSVVGEIEANQGGVMLTVPNLCDMSVTEGSVITTTTSSFDDCDNVIDKSQQQQDDLRPKVDTMNARLETHNVDDGELYTTKGNEEFRKLQFKLDVQVRVNELLSNELILLHRARAVEDEFINDSAPTHNVVESTDKIVGQLQEQLENQVERNKVLSSELATLTNKVTSDAAIQVGKHMDETKLEHQIEIKLLKKELAETKTMVKLLSREYDSLTDAYAVEQKSNDELEKSLEEVLHLLMTQRAHNDIHAKEAKMPVTKAK